MWAPFMMATVSAARVPNKPVRHRRIGSIVRQGAANERFPRHSNQQREAKLVKFLEAPQQGIIFFPVLAETEAGIEHHALPFHARNHRGLGSAPAIRA